MEKSRGGKAASPVRRVGAVGTARVLRDLQRMGEEGSYREAIRAFLTLSDQHATPMTGEWAALSLQYAIALQHAGLFNLAKDIYDRVILAGDHPRPAEDLAAARFSALVQLAVMRERLGDAVGALRLLDDLPRRLPRIDVGLARASLQSWISLTRLSALLSLGRADELRPLGERLRKRGDWNEQIWASVALGCLDIRSRSSRERAAAEGAIRKAIADMTARDEPGAPWIALLGGKHVPNAVLAREFLENAHEAAVRLGKFFVIGAASELLAQNRVVPQPKREWYLRRAMNAYARCGLLLLVPISSRMFRAARRFWGADSAEHSMVRAAHLHEPRENLVFSKMCKRLARTRRYGDKPWAVFEEFVRDWALARYPGKYVHVAAGEATVDAVIVQRNGSIALQAKHVKDPGDNVPKSFRFRQLRQRISIPPVRRYIFAVSSSRPEGWNESMWNSERSVALSNALPEGVECEVVTEPQLQIDALLDDALYDKYFGRGAAVAR